MQKNVGGQSSETILSYYISYTITYTLYKRTSRDAALCEHKTRPIKLGAPAITSSSPFVSSPLRWAERDRPEVSLE